MPYDPRVELHNLHAAIARRANDVGMAHVQHQAAAKAAADADARTYACWQAIVELQRRWPALFPVDPVAAAPAMAQLLSGGR